MYTLIECAGGVIIFAAIIFGVVVAGNIMARAMMFVDEVLDEILEKK